MNATHIPDHTEIVQHEFPLMCVIGFSYICNARCFSCPYTNNENLRNGYSDTPFMSEATFRLIADQCGQHGAWLRISGAGEPMLHPNAVEFMEYGKKAGARVGLITNGSRFTDESIQRLLKANIDMIEVSVDAGDMQSYAKVRQGLDWNTLVSNVTKMHKMRNELESSTKIIASAVNQTAVDIDKVAHFWEPLVDNFQKRKYLTWGINDPLQSADTTAYLPVEDHIPCPFVFERINFDSRGKAIICGFDIAANSDMGNIHEKSIKEIWDGEGFTYFREMHLNHKGNKIGLCSRCPDWKYRSWNHNYWKIVKNAEKTRQERFERLDLQDAEGCMADNGGNS